MIKTVEITNGTANIELIMFGLGSFFRFNRPLAINWNDCRGSVAQYFAILPYNEDYRNEIHLKLKTVLNDAKEIDEKTLEIMKNLLQIFENGTYQISIEQSYKYEKSENFRWEIAQNLRSSSLLESFSEHDDVDLITESYYDGYAEYFVFTQPSESINHERVAFYETQIKTGQRPIAMIYSGALKTTGKHEDGSTWVHRATSGNFILDGHHKLLAYKNLEISPSLIRIERKFNENDLCLDKTIILYDLKSSLHQCQLNHIAQHF